MISGYLIGDKQLIAKLQGVTAKVKPVIDATVQRLGYQLEANVKTDYLRGPRPQHLGIVTGRLANSITMRFTATPTTAVAAVGTNVDYGVMWETTGKPAQDIVPVKAKALRFEVGGEVLFRKRVHIPAQAPRPFLKPALAAIRAQAVQEIGAALQQVAVEAMR